MSKYVCEVCGYEYDPAVGDPDNGIAAGTPFEELPEDWVCPICGVGKDQFSLIRRSRRGDSSQGGALHRRYRPLNPLGRRVWPGRPRW